MSEIFLTIPPVPSLNSVYRNVRINLRVITPLGKAWKEEVKWIAISERLKQHWPISHSEKIVMELEIFWPDRRRRDADNCLKLLSDTFEGVLYEDDRWVLPRVLNWNVDKANPRVEIKLFKLNGDGGKTA